MALSFTGRGAGSDGAAGARVTPTATEGARRPQRWSDALRCCSYFLQFCAGVYESSQIL